jgi:hypothetical protein
MPVRGCAIDKNLLIMKIFVDTEWGSQMGEPRVPMANSLRIQGALSFVIKYLPNVRAQFGSVVDGYDITKLFDTLSKRLLVSDVRREPPTT